MICFTLGKLFSKELRYIRDALLYDNACYKVGSFNACIYFPWYIKLVRVNIDDMKETKAAISLISFQF